MKYGKAVENFDSSFPTSSSAARWSKKNPEIALLPALLTNVESSW